MGFTRPGNDCYIANWKDPLFFMGTSTISTGPFSSSLCYNLPEATSILSVSIFSMMVYQCGKTVKQFFSIALGSGLDVSRVTLKSLWKGHIAWNVQMAVSENEVHPTVVAICSEGKCWWTIKFGYSLFSDKAIWWFSLEALSDWSLLGLRHFNWICW